MTVAPCDFVFGAVYKCAYMVRRSCCRHKTSWLSNIADSVFELLWQRTPVHDCSGGRWRHLLAWARRSTDGTRSAVLSDRRREDVPDVHQSRHFLVASPVMCVVCLYSHAFPVYNYHTIVITVNWYISKVVASEALAEVGWGQTCTLQSDAKLQRTSSTSPVN